MWGGGWGYKMEGGGGGGNLSFIKTLLKTALVRSL